ncbi:Ig-like domain-containing protein [Candidatus Lokiarchaeum ossiferum]|uniref:Ig-like domain-containing protein n=1 Tax=Candidatus Lokiarchaeum ossiferum TaxID=2951803 RepID=UPI00352BF061
MILAISLVAILSGTTLTIFLIRNNKDTVQSDITKNDADKIPPDIQIISPVDNKILAGTVLIKWDVSDQDSELGEITISIDDNIVANNAEFLWESTEETDGIHTIRCTAKDSAENTNSAEIEVTVDNTPPQVSIIQPLNGTTVANTTLITMNVSEINGISHHQILINETLYSSQSSYSWETPSFANGWYEIECQAIDIAGNIGTEFSEVYLNNSDDTILSDEIFKVMTFNIKESGEDMGYPDWKLVVQEENADIIMFIETGLWDDNTDAKLKQYLTEFNSYFSEEEPYTGYVQDASLAVSGIACFSRYPITQVNQISEVCLDNGDSYDVTHDFYDIIAQVDALEIHFIGCHLKAMTGVENEQRREWEQEGILNFMDDLGNVPIVYLGDFNSFSPEDWGINTDQSGLGYGPLSMFIPPFTNPEMGYDYSSSVSEIHTWSDVHRTLNPQNLGYTSFAYNSRIDFIFVNQILAPYLITSTTGDTAHALTGSDHLSVDVVLDLNGDGTDYLAPQITILTPADQAFVSGSIEISIEATDLHGISTQKIRIDDTVVSTSTTYLWDTTTCLDGVHHIQAEATDEAGNTRIDLVEIMVDNYQFVVINEVLPDPFTAYTEEWIELYNPLSTTVDLSGYIIDDVIGGGQSPYVIPVGTMIPASGYIVLYQSETGIYFNNAGDDVNFIDPDGTTVLDSFTYSHSSDDVSWGRNTDGGSSWITFPTPTPGSTNSQI